MIKIDKISKDKKQGAVIYIVLAIGILLLISGNLFKSEPKPVVSPTKSALATETENILSEIKGVGSVRVMIAEKDTSESSFLTEKKENGVAQGSVLVVAEGGSDSRVQEKIIRAASAALGVDPHKIVVFERKE